MKLLIKQKVFSWTDSFLVYDQEGNVKYQVKAKILSIGHTLVVSDTKGNEVGRVKQRLISVLPSYDIEIQGKAVGKINKRFSLFRPKYEVECKGWRVDGDFLNWNYDVYAGCSVAARITKQIWHWGDTYVIDYSNPNDELMALFLVIAIDAANCTEEGISHGKI